MNLLKETKECIKKSGHTPDDIVFIGSKDGKYSMTWNEFNEVANVEYDDGYGGQEVASDLIVMFSDGIYMTRGEYDGSEWWDYIKPLPFYGVGKPIKSLVTRPENRYGALWSTVEKHQTELIKGEKSNG